MRGILLDWLVQVHARFCLLPETFFLYVNIIDRFLVGQHYLPLHRLQGRGDRRPFCLPFPSLYRFLVHWV